MGWQELAVASIVLAAVAFLASRFVLPRRRKKGSQTFVPLARVRKRPPPDAGGGCH